MPEFAYNCHNSFYQIQLLCNISLPMSDSTYRVIIDSSDSRVSSVVCQSLVLTTGKMWEYWLFEGFHAQFPPMPDFACFVRILLLCQIPCTTYETSHISHEASNTTPISSMSELFYQCDFAYVSHPLDHSYTIHQATQIQSTRSL